MVGWKLILIPYHRQQNESEECERMCAEWITLNNGCRVKFTSFECPNTIMQINVLIYETTQIFVITNVRIGKKTNN